MFWRIHDSGKVARESVGVTTLISQRKCKRDFQGNLRRSDDFAVAPRLTENCDFPTVSNCVQERLTVGGEGCSERDYTGKQRDALFLRDGHRIDSGLFSPQFDRKQVLPAKVRVKNNPALVHEFLWVRSVYVPFPNAKCRCPRFVNTQINRFLVRAPNRDVGGASHWGNLTKSVPISCGDEGLLMFDIGS